MHVTFNSQERTLREMVTLAASAGWKVTKVTRTPGSLFGYLVAVPMPIPDVQTTTQNSLSASSSSASLHSSGVKNDVYEKERRDEELVNWSDLEVIERAGSRCGTPTFGSSLRLSSVQEALARFRGGIIRRSGMGKIVTSNPSEHKEPPPVPLKPALTLSSGSGGNTKKKKAKPSFLSVVTLHGSSPTSPGPSTPSLHTPLSATVPIVRGRRLSYTSPKQEPPQTYMDDQTHSHSHTQLGKVQHHSPVPPSKKVIPRRLSLANLRPTTQHAPPLPTFTFTRQPSASPRSPKDPNSASPMRLRGSPPLLSHVEKTGAATSFVDARQTSQVYTPGFMGPSLIPVRTSATQSDLANTSSVVPPPSPLRTILRRPSFAQLSQPPSRMRSRTVAGITDKPFPGTFQQQRQDQEGNDYGMSADGLLKPSLHPFPAEESPNIYVPEFGTGHVLATAAKFEKGDFE